MDIATFYIYIAMYVYGFSLMLWAIFFDKRPTKRTRNGAIFGIFALICTLFYFFYVLATIGITFS
ncbi:unnamed protein product [Candidatus Protochlamydia amoebophila UWE25]|uniref:Uncharacterized protein n=1 Tax=Protochlamydia amoebophila (strain UWE25) TaxID=264201 RepID=Q6MFB4_PARUW|nr:unnamed protein product [Candidatus Protochlamydia amoebophila UWE25]